MNKRNTLTKKIIRFFIPLCPMGISPTLGAKHHPECPNTGDGPQGNKQPDGYCSPKVGELPERVRGMNKRETILLQMIFSYPSALRASPLT